MEKILEVKGLIKLYKNGRGASDINLELEKGDVVGLLGPNGSGKTTIMKAIVGLVHANAGSVRIFGCDISTDFECAMERAGCLIEAPAIYENMTAAKNLKLAARYYPNIDEKRITDVLRIVRLDKYKKDKVGRFSLGMKQRLGLALALLSEPELLILDEPANGLDIEGIVEIREIILRLAEEKGITFLISSHIAVEIEKTCNKVVVLHEGEMLSLDSMEDALKRNPTLEDYYLEKVREKRGPVEL
ncbi:MAG: ATP-binding cassette domain-containing protein [Clostridiales bacterium]|nr:ATP-binding cassette domain-containing protein [Clostridiales bacterium]